jgi:hypothetical protein
MPDPDETDNASGQDLAETFDEENITPDGRDIATSDTQRDVYDMTRAPEDADEALAPEDDFDPDEADEAELEEIVMADEDLDQPRTFARDDADLVAEGDLSPADLEAESLAEDDLEALGYAEEEPAPAPAPADLEARLDEVLEQTFPASDPFTVNCAN